MTFVFRMLVRETRASWRRLLFFFLCVAIGVSAIAAMRSAIQNVRGGLAREARTLTAADLVIQGTRAWDADILAIMERRLKTARVQGTTDVVETPTMVRPVDESKAVARMVELQAIEPAFPLYGTITLLEGKTYSHALLAHGGVIVRPELLAQLGVNVGESIVIGQANFEIRGVLDGEPGRRTGAFTLGPRVLIDAADLPRTGLLSFGSRARYQRLVRLPDQELQRVMGELRDDFRGKLVTVRSYRDTEDRVGRDLGTAENYLGLVGYVMVILGGIGVWSVTRVFIQQKLKSVAVLKCVGASAWQVLSVYVAQVLLLSAIGSSVGLVLGALMLRAIPTEKLASLGNVSTTLTWSASVQAFGVGVIVSLLFALVPLLEVRRIRPLLLLRDDEGWDTNLAGGAAGAAAGATAGAGAVSAATRRTRWTRRTAAWFRQIDWLRLVVTLLVIGSLIALAGWQAGSWRVGVYVSAGFIITAFVLHIVGLLLVRAVRPLANVSWFPLRHAVKGFGRPGHQTRVILLAVGLGSFFILGIRLIEGSLLHEFNIALRPDSPDLFFVDVQHDQEEPVRKFLESIGSDPAPRMLPVLRARVTGVRGRELNLTSVEDVRERGNISREFTVTYRDYLQPNERILEGKFWGTQPPKEPEVSIEQSLRDRAGLRLGDHVRFDILGRSFEAIVSSVRDVDWSDSRAGGFMFVFSPGLLSQAPHAYLGIMRGPQDPIARARLQRDLVTKFPNVSVIDVREVIRTVEAVLNNVTLAISVVGSVSLLCGLLILIGAVAMTKFQRLREVALLKTLGASSRVVATLLAIEYGLLGVLAGTVGAIAAWGLSWVISQQVLHIQWQPEPGTTLIGIALTAGLVGFVGVVASIDVLRRKPLAVLRAG
jgi:putative ABC transport system permease protein